MAVFSIPVVKAKGKFVEINTDADGFPDAIYEYALLIGLKAIVNRGTSTLKRENFPSADAFEIEALAIAERQVADIYEGKTRLVGAKSKAAKSAVGAEMTEALRLAKIECKAQVKAMGKVAISKVKAAEWTKAATAMVNADPDLWLSAARASLSATAVRPVKGTDFLSTIQEDKTLSAKAAEKKATAKAEREAKAAAKAKGKTPPKAKKERPATTHA